MLGSVDITVMRLRLAHLVEPSNAAQVRSAIRLRFAPFGCLLPDHPVLQAAPPNWRHKASKAPQASSVVRGSFEGDPDGLIQHSRTLPSYVTDLDLEVTQADHVWNSMIEDGRHVSQVRIGVFELLNALFEEHSKYKAKYAPRLRLVTIPNALSLFWASLSGRHRPTFERCSRSTTRSHQSSRQSGVGPRTSSRPWQAMGGARKAEEPLVDPTRGSNLAPARLKVVVQSAPRSSSSGLPRKSRT